MSNATGLYPRLTVDTTAKRVVSQAGAVLLVATAGKVGLDRALSVALTPWRKQWAVLDPGKILLDLAISVAVGGDCLADVGLLRAEPSVFGRVASDPTVSRLIDALAATPEAALSAINQVRAAVREQVWRSAGTAAPDYQISGEHPLVIDLDATLITAHWRERTGGADVYLLTELLTCSGVAVPEVRGRCDYRPRHGRYGR